MYTGSGWSYCTNSTLCNAQCALNEQSMAYLENSLNIKISLISGWRLAAPMAGGGEDGVGGDVDS